MLPFSLSVFAADSASAAVVVTEAAKGKNVEVLYARAAVNTAV
jgi:hypothetical protein